MQEDPEALMSLRSFKTIGTEQAFKGSSLRQLIGGKSSRADKIFDMLEATETVTPEMATVIAQMIQDLEDQLETAIKQDFTNTQSSLSITVATYSLKNGLAVTAYNNAVTADQAYVDCIELEDELSTNYSNCMDWLSNKASSRSNDCAASNSSSTKTYTFTADNLTCNFHEDDECLANFAAYETYVEGLLSSLKSSIDADNSIYESDFASCASSAQAEKDQSAQCGSLENSWTTKRANCENKRANRTLALCNFGYKYQDRCAAEAAYDAAKTAAETEGTTETSEDDRKSEWRTLYTLKCMLTNVKNGGEFDQGSFTTCSDEDDNYTGMVGVLDLENSVYSLVKNNAVFSHTTCAEGSFEFSTESWTISPDTAETRTVDGTTYTRNADVTYDFDSVDGNDPLTIC